MFGWSKFLTYSPVRILNLSGPTQKPRLISMSMDRKFNQFKILWVRWVQKRASPVSARRGPVYSPPLRRRWGPRGIWQPAPLLPWIGLVDKAVPFRQAWPDQPCGQPLSLLVRCPCVPGNQRRPRRRSTIHYRVPVLVFWKGMIKRYTNDSGNIRSLNGG